MRWVVSDEASRRLHLLSLHDTDVDTVCGRILRRPEVGESLGEALATGRAWSPRCFARLSPEAQAEWLQAGETKDTERD